MKSDRKARRSSQTQVFLAFEVPALAERPVEPAGLFYCGIVHDTPEEMYACTPPVCYGWRIILKEKAHHFERRIAA